VAHRALRALATPHFRLYLLAQLCSLTGTWAQQVAVAWWVYRVAHSSAVVGLSVALTQLPILLLSPLAGVLGDRVDRRGILLTTQVAGAAQAATLAFFAVAGSLELSRVLALSCALGVISAFDTPARQALVPRLVRREDIRNAVAWNAANVHVARLLGPVIAALLLPRFDVAACFIANAGSYVLSFAALLSLRDVGHERIGALSFNALQDGIRYCVGHALIRRVFILVATTSLLAIPYTSVLPAAAERWHGPQAQAFATLMAAGGLGSVVAASTLAHFESDAKLTIAMPVALLGASVALTLLGTTGDGLPAVLILAVVTVIGFALTIVISGGNVVLQHRVPEQLRGRVSSLFVLAFNGVVPVGALVIGALADRTSPPGALAIAGGAVGLVATAVGVAAGRARADTA